MTARPTIPRNWCEKRFPKSSCCSRRISAWRSHATPGSPALRRVYVAPIDADDRWLPTAAERLVECLDGSTSTSVSHMRGQPTLMSEAIGRVAITASLMAGAVWSTLLCHNFIGNASATLIRRSCFASSDWTILFFANRVPKGARTGTSTCELRDALSISVVPEILIEYRKTRRQHVFSGSGNDGTVAPADVPTHQIRRAQADVVSGMVLSRQLLSVPGEGTTAARRLCRVSPVVRSRRPYAATSLRWLVLTSMVSC